MTVTAAVIAIPLCSSLDDLIDVIEPLVRFIGLHITRDPLFVTKSTRLGEHTVNFKKYPYILNCTAHLGPGAR